MVPRFDFWFMLVCQIELSAVLLQSLSCVMQSRVLVIAAVIVSKFDCHVCHLIAYLDF